MTIILTTFTSIPIFASKQNILAGKDRFETAIEISKEFKTSKYAILVNSKSNTDLLCSTTLASQKNCPILLTNKSNISKETIQGLKRLNTDTVYIIGGEGAISSDIIKVLQENDIKSIRISGNNRYETSLEIAKTINKNKNIEDVVITYDEKNLGHVVSIAPIAGRKNMPIIFLNEEYLNKAKYYLDNKNIKNTYIVSSKEKMPQDFLNVLRNPKIIYGNDIYETNAKIIDSFYNNNYLETIYLCKGQVNKYIENSNTDKSIFSDRYNNDLVDAMLISPLASKENSPVVLLGDKVSEYQENILSKKSIKSLIQIGNGVSKEAIESIYNIKNNTDINYPSNTPIIPPSNTDKEENTPEVPPIEEDKEESVPEVPPIEEDEEESVPEVPPIEEDKEENIPEVPPVEEDNEQEGSDENKNIEYVINENELRTAIANKDIDIIKLSNDIKINIKQQITINRSLTICSKENENYTIDSLNSNQMTIVIDTKEKIILKNINIVSNKEAIMAMPESNIELINLKVENKSKTVPVIDIMASIVTAENLELSSDYAGIKLRTGFSFVKQRANLILKGNVYNTNKDSQGNYYPSISIENKINDTNKNKISIYENLSESYIQDNYIYEKNIDKKEYEKYSKY